MGGGRKHETWRGSLSAHCGAPSRNDGRESAQRREEAQDTPLQHKGETPAGTAQRTQRVRIYPSGVRDFATLCTQTEFLLRLQGERSTLFSTEFSGPTCGCMKAAAPYRGKHNEPHKCGGLI